MAAVRLAITKKDKHLNQTQFLGLIDDYINDSYAGRRTKKNGSRIAQGTINNYMYLRKHMIAFSKVSTFELKIYIVNNLTQSDKERARRYYRKMYEAYTDYLYNQGFFDNYVGLIIRCLRSFFNYLEEERNISVGTFHRAFFVPKEEIPIIALDKEQFSYLIYDEDFAKAVQLAGLERVKDIFVFGCTVALRVSDLLSLTPKNLVVQGDRYYVRVKSQKTNTYTSIKLPDYAVEIIDKYRSKQFTLLPEISSAYFNSKLKDLGKFIPDDFEIIKTRERRGKQVVVYKDPKAKTHYKLSDHITTHTMRKTAITTMLSLGMPEHVVRKISGHAANSREFYRYVRLSQSLIDDETDKVFEKIRML